MLCVSIEPPRCRRSPGVPSQPPAEPARGRLPGIASEGGYVWPAQADAAVDGCGTEVDGSGPIVGGVAELAGARGVLAHAPAAARQDVYLVDACAHMVGVVPAAAAAPEGNKVERWQPAHGPVAHEALLRTLQAGPAVGVAARKRHRRPEIGRASHADTGVQLHRHGLNEPGPLGQQAKFWFLACPTTFSRRGRWRCTFWRKL